MLLKDWMCFLLFFVSPVSSRSDAASSSGYESMRNDASHASSDSCSERGFGRGKRKGKLIPSWLSASVKTRRYLFCYWLGRRLSETPFISLSKAHLLQGLSGGADLRPQELGPGLENIRPSGGFRESPWNRCRSKYMKLTTWKEFRKQWIRTFR